MSRPRKEAWKPRGRQRKMFLKALSAPEVRGERLGRSSRMWYRGLNLYTHRFFPIPIQAEIESALAYMYQDFGSRSRGLLLIGWGGKTFGRLFLIMVHLAVFEQSIKQRWSQNLLSRFTWQRNHLYTWKFENTHTSPLRMCYSKYCSKLDEVF